MSGYRGTAAVSRPSATVCYLLVSLMNTSDLLARACVQQQQKQRQQGGKEYPVDLYDRFRIRSTTTDRLFLFSFKVNNTKVLSLPLYPHPVNSSSLLFFIF